MSLSAVETTLNGNTSAYQVNSIGVWTVYTRDTFSDSWKAQKNIVWDEFDETLQPSMPSATLKLMGGRGPDGQPLGIGSVRKANSTTFNVVKPESLVGRFVQIRQSVTPSQTTDEPNQTTSEEIRFSGQIVSTELSYQGQDADGNAIASHVLHATGLEVLLEQNMWQALADDNQNSDIVLQRVPPMNVASLADGAILGNRGATKGTNNYNYHDTDGNVWSHFDYLEYLIELLNTQFFAATGITWSLGDKDRDIYDGLKVLKTVAFFQGLTFRDVFNRLMPRSLGHSWFVYMLADDDTLYVEPVKLFSEDLQIDEDTQVLGNGITATLTAVADSPLRQHARILESARKRYSLIRVVGAPVRCTGTFSFADSTLEANWPAAKQTGYDTRHAGNAEALPSPEYADVYSRFVVPNTWDLQLGDGFGGTMSNSNPAVQGDGQLNTASTSAAWVGGKRFLPKTQLRAGIDYTADPVVDGNAAADTPEFLPIVAWVGDVDATPDEFCDLSGVRSFTGDRFGNPAVIPDRHQFGMQIKFSPQHVVARNQMTGTTAGTKAQTRFDYLELGFTASFELDEPISVTEVTGLPSLDGVTREKVFMVPEARLDFLMPNTILGVSDDKQGLTTSPNSYITLRDDSAKLRTIAAMAFAWYSKERRKISWRYNLLETLAILGSMVDEISDDHHSTAVNTPITRIRWSYPKSLTDHGSITLYTDFIELDAAGFASRALQTPINEESPLEPLRADVLLDSALV